MLAKAIEAFRSLAVVGSPAVTWAQIKEVVGDEVVDELGYRRLVGRSEKSTNKRPQFISLLSHWGIPGEETIKLKKRKFTFRFDEDGRLARVRNKKLSKWKRFKNSVKAFGKALWSEWTDNPWKFLFMGHAALLPGANQVAEGFEDGDFGDIAEGSYEMAKFSASIAATIFPATTAAGVAAMAVLVADTVYQASQGDWLGALGSAFSVAGGAAGYIGDVAAVGSTANLVSRGAAVGEGVVTAVDVGDDFVDALEDGDIFGALGSGFSLAGSVASVVSNGSELANGIGQRVSGNPIVNADLIDGIADNPLVNRELLEQTFTNPVVSSGTIDLIDEIGETASDLGAITSGVDATLGAIERDDLAAALTTGFATLGRGATAIGNPAGVLQHVAGQGPEGTAANLYAAGVSLTDAATAVGTGFSVADSIESGDLAGALSSGFNLAGDAATLAGNGRGIVADLAQFEPETLRALREFSQTTSVQLSEAAQIGGSVAAGDGLGVLENIVDLAQVDVANGSRLEGQLNFADQSLEVGCLVERVYDGDEVPGLDTIIVELAEVGMAASQIPAAAPSAHNAAAIVVPPEVGNVVGSDADGNLLVDTTGDGSADHLVRLAAGPPTGGSGPARGLGGQAQPGAELTIEQQRALVELGRTEELAAVEDRIAQLEQQIEFESGGSSYTLEGVGQQAPEPFDLDLVDQLNRLKKRRDRIPALIERDRLVAERQDAWRLEVGPEYDNLPKAERVRFITERLDRQLAELRTEVQGLSPYNGDFHETGRQIAELERRKAVLNDIANTPGSTVAEIDDLGAGFAVVDDDFFQANTEYFTSDGTDVILGAETRNAIINHPDVLQLGADIQHGGTGETPFGEGVIYPDLESEKYHVGNTPVHYRTVCNGGVCVTTYTARDDGIRDPLDIDNLPDGLPFQYDDKEGPAGEIIGGTPFRYRPINWEVTFDDPRVSLPETGGPAGGPFIPAPPVDPSPPRPEFSLDLHVPGGTRMDSGGHGHFGAPRGSRIHKGHDFLAAPGQPILAPVTGVVKRFGQVYSSDKTASNYTPGQEDYRLVVIDTPTGEEVHTYYVDPTVKVGDQVVRGQTSIGTLQDLRKKHGPVMLPHVHIEVVDTNGNSIDPLPHVDQGSATLTPEVVLPSPPRPGGPLADDDGDGLINSVDPDQAFPDPFPNLP